MVQKQPQSFLWEGASSSPQTPHFQAKPQEVTKSDWRWFFPALVQTQREAGSEESVMQLPSFPESSSSGVCVNKDTLGHLLLHLVNDNPLGRIKWHEPTLINAHRASIPTPAIKQHRSLYQTTPRNTNPTQSPCKTIVSKQITFQRDITASLENRASLSDTPTVQGRFKQGCLKPWLNFSVWGK